MERYYFLFGLALIYTIFATFQDIKKREVSNWLNFSFLGFALAYRAVYSVIHNEWLFFTWGAIGFIVFFVLANVFYYTKVFAGGDAKLLIAYGTILPIESFYELGILSVEFILILFVCGAAYSLIYSFGLSMGRRKEIWKEMKKELKKNKNTLIVDLILVILLILAGFIGFLSRNISIYAGLFLFFILILYFYLRAVEKVCFIKLIDPRKLTEGDWLEKNVKIGNKIIKKSVHGLSFEEIKLLRKHGKKVLIKEGVPFVPAFLIALIIMGFFLAVLEFDFESWLLSLF